MESIIDDFFSSVFSLYLLLVFLPVVFLLLVSLHLFLLFLPFWFLEKLETLYSLWNLLLMISFLLFFLFLSSHHHFSLLFPLICLHQSLVLSHYLQVSLLVLLP